MKTIEILYTCEAGSSFAVADGISVYTSEMGSILNGGGNARTETLAHALQAWLNHDEIEAPRMLLHGAYVLDVEEERDVDGITYDVARYKMAEGIYSVISFTRCVAL
jgi:succinyl-CoA synthetase beta subunit